jgi:hypothetical protein
MLAPSSCYCLIDLEYGLMGADWYRILSSKGVAMAAARTGDETKLGARAEGARPGGGELSDAFAVVAAPNRFKIWLMTTEDRLPDDFELPD